MFLRSLLLTALTLTVPLVAWAGQAQDGQEAVAMQNLAFQPRSITVTAGTTIVWTNQDPFEHTVTADDGSFDSGLIGQGGTYARIFDQPGTYAYYCIPHGSPGGGGMAGVVVVTAPPAPAAKPEPKPEPQPVQPKVQPEAPAQPKPQPQPRAQPEPGRAGGPSMAEIAIALAVAFSLGVVGWRLVRASR